MFIRYRRIYKVFKQAILLRFCIILTLYTFQDAILNDIEYMI